MTDHQPTISVNLDHHTRDVVKLTIAEVLPPLLKEHRDTCPIFTQVKELRDDMYGPPGALDGGVKAAVGRIGRWAGWIRPIFIGVLTTGILSLAALLLRVRAIVEAGQGVPAVHMTTTQPTK